MRILKRTISLMLVVLMCFSFMSTGFIMAFADDTDMPEETIVEQAQNDVDSTEANAVDDENQQESESTTAGEVEEVESTETVLSGEEPQNSEEFENPTAEIETPSEAEVPSEVEEPVLEETEPVEETKPVETMPVETEVELTETEPVKEEAEEDDQSWRNAGLFAIVNGRFLPYNPVTNEIEGVSGTKGWLEGVYYSNAFGGHANDLNGYVVKAGGQYDSWKWGSDQWWPASTGQVAQTGKRVCTYNVWCQNGPMYYSTMGGTPLALPIRVSMESGYSSDVDGYGSYTQTGTGVPPYKLESLYTAFVPEFSSEEFRDISIIYGVARGMGGMTYNSDTDITMAGFTLIMSRIWGYIGVGSDRVFHGSPMGTTSNSVNKYMGEIIARCNVYTTEKGLTGSKTGDNTLTVITNKVGAVTNVSGWYVKSGSHGANLIKWFFVNKSQSSGNQEFIWTDNLITFDTGASYSLKKAVSTNSALQDCVANNPLYSLKNAKYGIYTNSNATGTPVETLTVDANGNATGTKKFAVGTTLYAKELEAPTGYLLDTTIYSITITSTVSQNVFKVYDTPSLDPMSVKIYKVDKDNAVHYLEGAVFKVTYYSAHWADDSTPVMRTWYFKSDANGTIKYKDSYLASGYTSSALFKDDHGTPAMPLGIVQVKEVVAPNGFEVLDLNLYYNITQDSNGYAVGEWVTPSLKPIASDPNYSQWYVYTPADDTLKIYDKSTNKPVTVKKIAANDADLIAGNNAYTLKGAKFEFSATGYETKVVTTDANGQAESPLEYEIGTVVTVKEIAAPTGYIIASPNTQTITVKDNQDNIVTFKDPPIFGSVPEIIKLNASNDEPLGAALFQIKYYPGTSTTAKYTWTVSSDAVTGKLNLNFSEFPDGKVPFGCFEIIELEAPQDFIKDDTVAYYRIYQDNTSAKGVWVASLEDNTVTTSYNPYIFANGDVLTWRNAPVTKPVTLKKSYSPASVEDLIDGNPLYSLSGAKYAVYVSNSADEEYELSEYITTDANGEAVSAKSYIVGKWVKVKEVEAPLGCKLNEDFTPAKQIVNGENLFEVSDEPVFGVMPELVKVDVDTNEPLPGAVFKYSYYAAENSEGEAKYEWYFVTDANGEIKYAEAWKAEGYSSADILDKIPLGTVVVEEVKAPEGYKFAGDYKATWTIRQHESGSSTVDSQWETSGNEPVYIIFEGNEVKWGNTLIRYSFSGKKVDALTGEMAHFREGDKLEAEFDLYYDGNTEGNKVGTWFIGSEGFPAGEYEAGSKIGHFKIEDGKVYTSEAVYAPGTYRVVEVEGTEPVDYNIDVEEHTFVLSADTTGEINFVAEEPMKANEVTLRKIDALTNEAEHYDPTKDFVAKFDFVYTGEKAITIMMGGEKKTFETGNTIVKDLVVEQGKTWSSASVFTGEGEGLPAGTYKFVETEAPYGYDKCADIEVVINSESNGETYPVIAKDARQYGGALLTKVNDLYDEMTVIRHNFDGIKFNIVFNGFSDEDPADLKVAALKGSDAEFAKGDIVTTVEVHWNPAVNAWQASTIEYIDGEWQEKETGYVLLPGRYYFQEVKLNEHGQANDFYFVDEEFKYFEVTPNAISDKYADEDSAMIAKDRPVRGNLSFQKLSQSHYPVEGVPYLLTNTTTGEQHIIVTGADGWFYSKTEYSAEQVNLNDALLESLIKDEESGLYTINTKDTRIKASDLKVGGVWFYIDESGESSVKVDLAKYGALTLGHYVLQELYADANWGLDSNLNHEEFEVTNEELFTGKPAEVTLSNDATIIDDEHLEIHTNAWNAELALGHHMVLVGNGENKIIDTVSVNADGIVPGYKYRLNAQLHTYYFEQASLEGIVGSTEFGFESIDAILEADAADGEADGIIHIDVVLSIPDDFYTVMTEEGEISIDLEGRYTYISESLEVLALNAESGEEQWEQRAEHNDKDDQNQWILFPRIRTQAWDAETLERVSRETLEAEDTVTWVDELKYEAIWQGYTVRIHTWLVDSETGEPLVIDGEPVEAWKEVTSEWFTGTFQVEVTLSTEGLAGKTYTFMEEVYAVIEDGEGGEKEVFIGGHKDKDDTDQQIQIPEGHTTAWGVSDGVHMVQVGEECKVSDCFYYNNLVEGKEYELAVNLMDKATGEPLNLETAKFYFNGELNETNKGKFVAEGRQGCVYVDVVFDSSELAGMQTVFFERVSYNDVDIIIHESLEDEEQTVNLIDIHTLAHFDEDMKYIQAGATVNWYDEVYYTGLEVGKEYTVSTKIAFVPSKAEYEDENYKVKFFKEDGILEVTFVPETPDGSITVVTEVDTSKLGGQAFVFFEYLDVTKVTTDEEGTMIASTRVEIAKHENVFDEGQTVRVLDMHTKAVSAKNGTKILELGKSVQLKDTVSNFGFPIDEEFTWVGYVYDVKTGKPIEQNGKPIKLEWTGKLTDPNQEIIMLFTLDTTVLEGKKLSIMEEVYNRDGKLILEHNKDLKDDDQTVTVDTLVRTGDGTTPMTVGIGLVAAGILFASLFTVMYVRRKKVDSVE